jgi:hypothetical protein
MASSSGSTSRVIGVGFSAAGALIGAGAVGTGCSTAGALIEALGPGGGGPDLTLPAVGFRRGGGGAGALVFEGGALGTGAELGCVSVSLTTGTGDGIVGDFASLEEAFSFSSRSRLRRSRSSACFSAARDFSSASLFSCCNLSSTDVSREAV